MGSRSAAIRTTRTGVLSNAALATRCTNRPWISARNAINPRCKGRRGKANEKDRGSVSNAKQDDEKDARSHGAWVSALPAAARSRAGQCPALQSRSVLAETLAPQLDVRACGGNLHYRGRARLGAASHLDDGSSPTSFEEVRRPFGPGAGAGSAHLRVLHRCS